MIFQINTTTRFLTKRSFCSLIITKRPYVFQFKGPMKFLL